MSEGEGREVVVWEGVEPMGERMRLLQRRYGPDSQWQTLEGGEWRPATTQERVMVAYLLARLLAAATAREQALRVASKEFREASSELADAVSDEQFAEEDFEKLKALLLAAERRFEAANAALAALLEGGAVSGVMDHMGAVLAMRQVVAGVSGGVYVPVRRVQREPAAPTERLLC